MRRFVHLAALALIATLCFASNAVGGEAKARTVEQHYTHPNGIRTTHYQAPLEALPEFPGLTFTPGKGERFVRFVFKDDNFDFVYVHIFQEGLRAEPSLDTRDCSGDVTLPLATSKPIEVRFYSGLCTGHEVGVATQGVARATFYLQPPHGVSAHPDRHKHR